MNGCQAILPPKEDTTNLILDEEVGESMKLNRETASYNYNYFDENPQKEIHRYLKFQKEISWHS